MSNTIPCPNPVCTHQFSQSELQAAAQLLCPKCGFRMQGKASAAPAKPMAAPKAAPPTAKPIHVPTIAPAKAAPTKPAAAPLAVPLAPKPAPQAPPLATPINQPVAPSEAPVGGDGDYFDPDVGADAGALVRTAPRPPRQFNWIRALIILLTLGFALCIVIVAIVTVYITFDFGSRFGNKGVETRGNIYFGQIKGAKDGNEKIYKLALSKDEWEIDRDVLTRFEAHAAWKNKQMEHDFWFAVVVQDFGQQKPRDAEMLRIGIDRLESYFSDTLELEKKAEPAKIKDLAAQKIQFKGQIKSANWLGECYMFFNNGIAYWLFLASPDWRTVEHFADELPKKYFFVESERRGWREQPPPMETATAANNKFSVNVLKNVWEKNPNPKDIDENGVLFLFGKYTKAKDNRKNANFLVFTLEKSDDLKTAMKAARDHLDSKVKNENEMYKIALASEVSPGQTDAGTSENVGNRPGRIVDLKRLVGEEVQRYYFLAVVIDSGKTYVVLADCSWDSRQIWRQDFLDVMRSMNFSKGD